MYLFDGCFTPCWRIFCFYTAAVASFMVGETPGRALRKPTTIHTLMRELVAECYSEIGQRICDSYEKKQQHVLN